MSRAHYGPDQAGRKPWQAVPDCLALQSTMRCEMKTAAAVQQDQNRADYVEYLYELFDRSNPSVEHCFTYTGLHRMYVERVGADVAEARLMWFDEEEESIRASDAEFSAAA